MIPAPTPAPAPAPANVTALFNAGNSDSDNCCSRSCFLALCPACLVPPVTAFFFTISLRRNEEPHEEPLVVSIGEEPCVDAEADVDGVDAEAPDGALEAGTFAVMIDPVATGADATAADDILVLECDRRW